MRSWRRFARAGTSGCCCTASPAAARPRSISQAARGGARARPLGDRARAGDRAHAADGAPVRGAVRRPRSRCCTRSSAIGERYDEWQRLRRGEARVCVGPRSAVFAPLRDLGPDRGRRGARLRLQAGERSSLRRPRGRRRRRARAAGAVLVCGSATPRPESWVGMQAAHVARAGGRGRGPAAGGARRHARPAARTPSAFARRARGRQGAWRQGDRAREPARMVGLLRAQSCGHAWTCPRCDVTLTLHRANDARAPDLPPLRPLRAGAAPVHRMPVDHDRQARRGHAEGGGRAGGCAWCPKPGIWWYELSAISPETPLRPSPSNETKIWLAGIPASAGGRQ